RDQRCAAGGNRLQLPGAWYVPPAGGQQRGLLADAGLVLPDHVRRAARRACRRPAHRLARSANTRAGLSAMGLDVRVVVDQTAVQAQASRPQTGALHVIWGAMLRNRKAMAGGVILLLFVLVALI